MINGDYIMVVAPENYPGKKYRNKYCYEHVLNYWLHYNVLPNKNEVIHHKDGNKHNNDISNLELLTNNKHVSKHVSERLKTFGKFICPVCGKEFVKEKRKSHLSKNGVATYCSRSCANEANALRKKQDQQFLKAVSNNVVEIFYSKA